MSTDKTPAQALSRHAFAVPLSERLKEVVDGFERWSVVPPTKDDLDELKKCIAMAEVLEAGQASQAPSPSLTVDQIMDKIGHAIHSQYHDDVRSLLSKLLNQ